MNCKILFKSKNLCTSLNSFRCHLHLAPPFLVDDYVPNSVEAYRSGWFKNRVEEAIEELRECRACPRDCGVNRIENKTGACNTGEINE